MKAGRIAVMVLGVVALLSATIALTASTAVRAKSSRPTGDRASMVARGEHLVTTMSCNDCHTPGSMYGAPDFSRRLSGSELGWQGPWGVSYPQNLTPDMETGIGKWSEADIVKALRTGMRPDGSILQPPMPWPNLTQLTDEEAYAIAAYLKSIPAISHMVPDRIPPGQQGTGSIVTIPPPSAWDAPRGQPQDVAPTQGKQK
jgi:mono/diheme cytochrome c family protein